MFNKFGYHVMGGVAVDSSPTYTSLGESPDGDGSSLVPGKGFVTHGNSSLIIEDFTSTVIGNQQGMVDAAFRRIIVWI